MRIFIIVVRVACCTRNTRNVHSSSHHRRRRGGVQCNAVHIQIHALCVSPPSGSEGGETRGATVWVPPPPTSPVVVSCFYLFWYSATPPLRPIAVCIPTLVFVPYRRRRSFVVYVQLTIVVSASVIKYPSIARRTPSAHCCQREN